jgi:hypothetical protein
VQHPCVGYKDERILSTEKLEAAPGYLLRAAEGVGCEPTLRSFSLLAWFFLFLLRPSFFFLSFSDMIYPPSLPFSGELEFVLPNSRRAK